MGTIYRIWNAHNGKSYIGQSYEPYNQIRQHLMPWSEEGRCKIHADLHKYPPESWKWEILARRIDERSSRILEPPLGFVHKSINALECELIRQYDSIKNGYNDQPSGGVEYRQTFNESYTPAQMQQEIYDAIDAYRFQHQHGTSRIDIKRFFDLSEQAMNPDVKTRYPLPNLDDSDLQLVGEWCRPSRSDLHRTSLIAARSRKDKELDRLLSARSAEKVAADFYRHYRKNVADISITQIDENRTSEWKKFDLYVDDFSVDVKNSRHNENSPDRYTEHYIQKKFRHNAEYQNVTIAGIFSPYLWTYELLDEPESYHEYREIQFLGETTWKKLQKLKREFKDSVDFERADPTGISLLPPWVFDYPEYAYAERNEARKELKNFPNLDLLKGAPFEFDLIPVSIAAGIHPTEILGNKVLEEWEQGFLAQLRNQIEKYGLSLPFLFLTILTHFLNMAHSPKTSSDFEPDRYRKFLFYKGTDKPLGIYDPLKTIDALIKALSTLWTAEDRLIRQFRMFRLISFNILRGKPESNEDSWSTLIAYCGVCGKNPLVLGESKHCEYRRLICPACGFCCPTCRGEDQAAVLENAQ